jgi:hypothetical protein
VCLGCGTAAAGEGFCQVGIIVGKGFSGIHDLYRGTGGNGQVSSS